jgi:hypothetical protein
MLSNEDRFGIELALRPFRTIEELIELELQKVNGSIDRKWNHLDDFSASWSWTMWKNWKDAMYGEISYREYLLILQKQIKK